MEPIPQRFVRAMAFVSGFCALVYQIAWMRHLRLIFGASTGASAAVLAIFMGGLGVGALWIGRRADGSSRPLAFYGTLELGVAASAAVSPFLLDLARASYVGLGGSQALGNAGAVAVQLTLSSIVLAVPCVLMGATLPTLARAVERADDPGRAELGLVYGVNTLGAVLGCTVTTFFFLEFFGVRASLWFAAGLNVLIGLAARSRARRSAVLSPETDAPDEHTGGEARAAPVGFVYLASTVVGFAFFSMELVWYRMFAPLLGGSSYSFGLILTVALLGIGGGAAIYGRRGSQRRPSVAGFAVTCALEAALIAIPYGVGDDLAAVTLVLRDLQAFGFGGLVLGWACVTMLVVLPPALISGYQFPLLVGLLGSGRRRVASQVGATYLCNTIGAILGSILSGFGLLVALGATQLWLVMIVVLLILALGAFGMALVRREGGGAARGWVLAASGVALVSMFGEGPTSAWRHSPIGAGRVSKKVLGSQQLFENFRRTYQGSVFWEADGRESSVALLDSDGFAFAVSGKVDGHTVGDLPTTVMSGLIGASMHPNPRLGFVIGLGTGSTAGWLAQVPTMERVDVVEFEPAIRRVAEVSGPVNEDMLSNPKVRLLYGDGREVLMTSDDQYDVVFSEPSNPYRAGIASLYSQDFYRSAVTKMTDRGVFVQWVQTYEIDALTIKTAIATMKTVFPLVEIWSTKFGSDILLVGFKSDEPYSLAEIETRAQQYPYREGLEAAWGVSGVGGMLSGFIAGGAATEMIADQYGDFVDTDDSPILEFGFSRTVGRAGLGVSRDEIVAVAQQYGGGLPNTDAPVPVAAMNDAVDARRMFRTGKTRGLPSTTSPTTPEAIRARARAAAAAKDYAGALALWASQPGALRHPGDFQWHAMASAKEKIPEDPKVAEVLARAFPVQLELTRAVRLNDRGTADALAEQLVVVFNSARAHPLYDAESMRSAFTLAKNVAEGVPARAMRLLEALEEPFSLHRLDRDRITLMLTLSKRANSNAWCRNALHQFEPYTPWVGSILRRRVACYEEGDDPLAVLAREEYAEFLSKQTPPF